MEFVSLGKLTKAKIRHDDSGIKSSWYLDRIEVTDEKVWKGYFIRHDQWPPFERNKSRT